MFSYSIQDESSFTVVKNPKAAVKKTFRRGIGYNRLGSSGQRAPLQNRSRTAKKTYRGGYANRGGRGGWGAYNATISEIMTSRKKEYSVEIKPDWVLRESIDFAALNKLDELSTEPQGEIL